MTMIKEYRMLSFVQRWGITPRLHPQSVAEHCYFVTLYCSVICDMFKIVPHDRLRVLEYALRHDLQEIYTGDIPGPAKRALRLNPDLSNSFMSDRLGGDYREVHRTARTQHLYIAGGDSHVTPHDVVKVADLIDELFYLKIESLMGNRMVEKLPAESDRRLARALEPFRRIDPHQAKALITHVDEQLARLGREGAHLPPMDTDLPISPRDNGSLEPGDFDARRKDLIQSAIDLGFTGAAQLMMEAELPKPGPVETLRPQKVTFGDKVGALAEALQTHPAMPGDPRNLDEAGRAAYISPNRTDKNWSPGFVWFKSQGMDGRIQPQKWSDTKYLGEESWKKPHMLAVHPVTDWEFDFLTLDQCAAKWPLEGYTK